MPASIQGFGTTFYGKRDFHADGSFVTTEWFVILFLPLVPLRSHRVKEGEIQGTPPLYYKQNYAVLVTSHPNWKQVAYTYLYAVGYVAWVIGACELSRSVENALHTFLSRTVSDYVFAAVFLGAIAIPAVIPIGLRCFAMRRWGVRKPGRYYAVDQNGDVTPVGHGDKDKPDADK